MEALTCDPAPNFLLNEPTETVAPLARSNCPAPVCTDPPSLRFSCARVWLRPLRFSPELAFTVTVSPPMELGLRKMADAAAFAGAGPSVRFPGTAIGVAPLLDKYSKPDSLVTPPEKMLGLEPLKVSGPPFLAKEPLPLITPLMKRAAAEAILMVVSPANWMGPLKVGLPLITSTAPPARNPAPLKVNGSGIAPLMLSSCSVAFVLTVVLPVPSAVALLISTFPSAAVTPSKVFAAVKFKVPGPVL